jgi:hypothetical protein
LPSVNWSSQGDFPWVEDQAFVFEGTTSMKSGAISDLGQSDLTLSGNVTEAGEIRFNYKVSSEEGYDFLRFYIDGTEMASWSGLVDWTEISFPVSTGQHEFQWNYTKDDIVASNEDAAWIDFVHLPTIEEASQSTFTPESKAIKVWPNPTQSDIVISGLSSGNCIIRLYDSRGNLVDERNATALETTLNYTVRTELPTGIYMIQAIQKNGISNARILKK